MQTGRYAQLLGSAAGDYHLLTGPRSGLSSDSNAGRAWQRGGKDVRRSSAMFIAPDILVELGECTAAQLTAYDIPHDQIRHLVVSHGHFDHFYPEKVLDFADGLSHQLQIHGNTMIRDAINFAATYRWDDDLKEHVVCERRRNYTVETVALEETFSVGTVNVTPVLSSHMIDRNHNILDQQALNFVFEREGKSLFYNLDSNWLLPKTLAFLSSYQFDIAVLDGTWCDLTDINIKQTGHQSFAMLEKTLAKFQERGMLKDDAVIVYSHLSTDAVPPHEETAARLAQQGIALAYDGMVLEF